MKVEIGLTNEDAIDLQNITHVSYSSDLNEMTFYHKNYTVAIELDKIESMVIRK